MGARTYLPALGQFTATDPIPGGNTTTYTYPQDPINAQDYTGTRAWDGEKEIAYARTVYRYASNVKVWKPRPRPKGEWNYTFPYQGWRIDPMKYAGPQTIHIEDHLVVGVSLCYFTCFGVAIQAGHVTFSGGAAGFGGKGVYVGWNGNEPQPGRSQTFVAGGGAKLSGGVSHPMDGSGAWEFDLGVGGGGWIGTMFNFTF